ncbi:MAG: S-layer homology domain-containing protein [Acidimicrobiaceae bacterium]|nr:S-layer homology domain-containing protein [Acidimicrobiaceae bacterium]
MGASLLVAAVAAEEIRPGEDNEAEPSHSTGQSACVGDAAQEQGFVDVPSDHPLKAAINCLAYYGITAGTGDGTTFAPDAVVTGAQLVSFMERAAIVAGAGRDAVIGDFDAAAAAATRADAAVLVVRLLVAVTGSNSRANVEMDDAGTVTINGRPPEDFFADSRNTQPLPVDGAVSALYELGVARGRPDGSFEPGEPATRAEVAALITGALAHTRARPEGVTIQQNVPGEVVVSVRDAGFAPLFNVPIDLFSVPTRLLGTTAFKSDGTCGAVRVPAGGDPGSKCSIGLLDPATDDDGDLIMAVDVDGRGGTTVWAWTGDEDDRVTGGGAELARVDLTETEEVVATGAKVTHDIAEEAHKARFGETVTVTVQLIGAEDRDAVPPPQGASYRVEVTTWRGLNGTPASADGTIYALDSFTESVDGTGRLTFTLTAEDPDPDDDDDDTGDTTDEVRIRYTVSNAAGNTLAAPTGASCSASDAGSATEPRCPVFTDERPMVRKVEVTTPTKYASPPASGSASNVATIAVTDQYGKPLRNVGVLLTSDIDPETDVELVTRARYTLRDGRVRIPYLYKSSKTAVETLGAQLPGPDGRLENDPSTNADESADNITLSDSPDSPPYLKSATFYWLAEPTATSLTAGGGACVLLSSVSENTIIVDTDTTAGTSIARVVYDAKDHLYLDGPPVTLTTFKDRLAGWEDELADGTAPEGEVRFRLGWEYRTSASGITRWLLTEGSC